MRPSTLDVPPSRPGGRCASADVLTKRLASVGSLIGHTPLLAIHGLCRSEPFCIYAKLESLNFTGSIKDRMAHHILVEAYRRGEIWPGDTIAEATSGNTGIAFAALGRTLGHPVRIYMPDWMSRERVLLIQSLGATVVPISAEEDGFLGAIACAEAYAKDGTGVFHPRQFENSANVDAHYTATGPELLAQLKALGVSPTAFVAGVGTGGTVMGVGSYLIERLQNVAIHPLEPANSPTLRCGERVGKHRIQGISDEFIPQVVNLEMLDDIVDVWDGDAILMAQLLASRLGLAVGTSSGANFLGALMVAREQGKGAVVATVFPDSNKKYLTTDLCRAEPVEDHYMTPHIELLSFRAVRC